MKKLFWGDAHYNLRAGYIGRIEEIYKYHREQHLVDFVMIAYYPHARSQPLPGGYQGEIPEPHELQKQNWNILRDFAEKYCNAPELPVFPGYEWHGNSSYGDHNVFFRKDPPSEIFHFATLPELYNALREYGKDAMAIPHHTAYIPGVRSKNWNVHDEKLSPVSEIFSSHGCSETDEEHMGLRYVMGMSPGVSGGTYEDALDMGIRSGAIASGDNHADMINVFNNGLTGIYATELSNEAVWQAFIDRHTYGVTGDRIKLDFRSGDNIMGDIIEKLQNDSLTVDITGCDAIDRIELLRNNNVIATHCHQGTWQKPASGNIRAKIRYEYGWGPSPFKIDPTAIPAQNWQGRLKVKGGIISGVERYFTRWGQRIEKVSDNEISFDFTCKPDIEHGIPVNQSVLVEIEGNPETVLELDGEKLHDTCSLAEAMNQSKMIYSPEWTGEFIKEKYGIGWKDVERHDNWYYFANKIKRHRAIPEAGYRKTWKIENLENVRPANYRIRVEQRNGQKAWSSPIWAE